MPLHIHIKTLLVLKIAPPLQELLLQPLSFKLVNE
jgi:hypothetical protein